MLNLLTASLGHTILHSWETFIHVRDINTAESSPHFPRPPHDLRPGGTPRMADDGPRAWPCEAEATGNAESVQQRMNREPDVPKSEWDLPSGHGGPRGRRHAKRTGQRKAAPAAHSPVDPARTQTQDSSRPEDSGVQRRGREWREGTRAPDRPSGQTQLPQWTLRMEPQSAN